MAGCVYSSFTIKNENGSEVSSQVDSLREITKYHCVSDMLHHSCICSCITMYGAVFESGRSIGKSYVDCEVENLVQIDAYGTNWVSNTGWSIGFTF